LLASGNLLTAGLLLTLEEISAILEARAARVMESPAAAAPAPRK
jgi:hypothetical protein